MNKWLILMVFLAVLPMVTHRVYATTNIDNCTTLNTIGETYLLTTDIDINLTGEFSSPPCFYIVNNSITLDCQGHNVTGYHTKGLGNYGFYIECENTNITVKNCDFDGWTKGGYDCGYSDVTIQNNTFINNGQMNSYSSGALELDDTTGIIKNNTFINNNPNAFTWAIYDEADTGNITIENNTFLRNNYTFFSDVEESSSLSSYFDVNFINDSNFINPLSFPENGGYSLNPIPNLYWNLTIGNYWIDFSDNETLCGTCNANVESPYGGICSNSYIIDENNTDYLPLCIVAEEPEPPPNPVIAPVVVCFTIKDVCVKLSDFTIYVNNDKGWFE